jgi:fatty acid desaturase
MALYAGYPIGRASLRRKLIRDATGQTGVKLMRQLLGNVRSIDRRSRRTVWKILAVQGVLLAAAIASGHWWLYPVLWLGPYLTVWRVINRLRSIAEHGGMQRSKDRRQTTHSVRQHLLGRFILVPYNIGWHLAHHVDSGIPFRNLPRFHTALAAAGYVDSTFEYPSYPAIWRALSADPT